MNSVSLAITILVIVALAALTIWVLQFIFLIMGWSKIKNGGFNRKMNVVQIEREDESNDEIEVIEEFDEEEAIVDGSYKSADSLDVDEEAGSDTGNDKKKWIIWGSIGVGVLALILIAVFAWLTSSDIKERRYVFTQNIEIHSAPSNNSTVIADWGFGKELSLVEIMDGAEWAKVKYNDDYGTVKEGYALLNNLVDYDSFKALEQAGFKQNYVQQAIQAPGQRRAVIDYFSQNQSDSIKVISPGFEGVCALAECCDGVETLAFVAGKKYTLDVLVVYTIDENEQPHLYSQNEMPRDAEGIKAISRSSENIHVTLTPAKGNNNITMSFEEEPKTEISTPDYEEPVGNEYTHEYKGTINGKYAIEMKLTSDGGAFYTGEYFYTKNGTPIQLRGQLTDDYEHLVLEEYVGMNMTGKFEGTISSKRYHGTWTSANGETVYTFNVTTK